MAGRESNTIMQMEIAHNISRYKQCHVRFMFMARLLFVCSDGKQSRF